MATETASFLRRTSDHGGQSTQRMQRSVVDQMNLSSDLLHAWGTSRTYSDLLHMQMEFTMRVGLMISDSWLEGFGMRRR